MTTITQTEHLFDYAEGPMGLAVQRTFDDLGTALVDTEFCIFDLETTGGSPDGCRITEIGAVKVRGGEVLGEFSSLVNPGVSIPTGITMLTGITDAMVAESPPIEYLLPAFIEFIGGAVLVAHNASFDTRFLAANLARHSYPLLANPVVCTVRLARRLVRDEVPNLKLATLARALRARTSPTHRALDDARATTDVFHSLLERGGRFGVSHIDDLLWFQSMRGHPSYQKVRLAETLPRARGVYLFRDATGRVLYVGKATDLRARVRSYFGGDERRRIDDLLRQVERVDHLVCASDLEASVIEARLIRAHSPRFNRAQRGKSVPWYLRLTAERYPRLAATRTPMADTLGPLASGVVAAVKEALEHAFSIRTCTPRIGARTNFPACARGQIGRCPAPCERALDAADYAPIVSPVAAALRGDARAVLVALGARMDGLAEQSRFEEAALVRERLSSVVSAVRTTRAIHAVTNAGRLTIEIAGARLTIENGVLASVSGASLPVEADGHTDEPRLIAAWLARNLARMCLISCTGEFAQSVAGGRELATWNERLRTLRAVESPR